VDILSALEKRLSFIRRFYLTAGRPFEAIRRRCNSIDSPTEDDPPDAGFERQDATRGLELIGQLSLTLVAKAIEDYLRLFIVREAGQVPVLEGKSKFERYVNFLLVGCP
jgi:hypothetical protein